MRHRFPLVLAGVAALMLAGSGLAGAVQGPISINGDGPELSNYVLFLSVTGSCGLSIGGTVVTDAGGGTDTFTLQITDEGAVIASQDFAYPADGAAHPFATEFSFQHIFVGENYGLTIVDPGGLGLVEFPDLFPLESCSIQNIPTLSTAGVAGFGLLLAGAAAAVLVRRRRS